jgi:hypothetical protein
MKNSLLTPVIAFLLLSLIYNMATLFDTIGISAQLKNFAVNYYFIILFFVELAFIFRITKDLKYSQME